MNISRAAKKMVIGIIALGFVFGAVGLVTQPQEAHAQSKTVSGDKTRYDDESGIEDWVIRIYEGVNSSLGTEEASTTTDANGDYSLTVDPVSTSSTYLVCEEDKSGWNQTSPTLAESDTASCPNGTVGHTLSGSSTWSSLTLGFTNEDISTSDTGGGGDILQPRSEQEPDGGSVSGTKRDYDTEVGLSGWEISLHEFWSQSDGYDTNPNMTTTTDDSGEYQFKDVPAGDYVVCEEKRSDWTQRTPESGDDTYECENGTTGYIVTVEEGGTVSSNDFMNEDNSDGGSITGTKRDYDTEEGLSGWEITLHDFWSQSDGYDTDPEMTTTTDEAGEYRFAGVPAGDYLVCEENRSGWEQTDPTDGEQAYECENGTDGYVVTVTEEGSIEGGYDFMNRENPDGDGSVYGKKRSYDTESGLSGWEITLHEFWSQSDGFDETPTQTTTTREDDPETETDESGLYVFDDVSAGRYLVCEENRIGWTQHTPQSGEDTYQCENGTEGHIVTVDEENPEVGSHDFMNESGGEACAKYYEEGGEYYYGEEGNEMPPECDDWGGGDEPDDGGGGDECGQYYNEDGEYYGENSELPAECEDWGEECSQYYEEGAEYNGQEGEVPPKCEGPGGGEPDGGSANSPDSSSTVGFPDTGDGSLPVWFGPSK